MKKILFLLLTNCVFAGTLDEIRERGVLRVATFENNLPFSFVGEKESKGVDIEIAKALAKAIFDDENKVEFLKTNHSDRIPDLMSDAADVVLANFSATKWRTKAVDFASPYLKSNLTIVSNKSKTINGLSDLSAIKIGAVKNSLGAEFIKKTYPNLTLVEVKDRPELYDALKDGTIDAAIMDTLIAYRWINENNNLASKITLGNYEYSAPAVKKGNKELLAIINEEMNKLKADGRLESWYKSYMQPMFGEHVDSADVLAL